MKKLTRQTIIERLEKEILDGRTEKDYVVCDDSNCNNCEMANMMGVGVCKVITENLYEKVLRKVKLKKLLS